MVTTCAVKGCKSEWSPYTTVSFHQVPKNPKLLALWLKVLNMRPCKEAKICSLHFRSRDLVDYKDRKQLKRDALPAYNNRNEVVESDDNSSDEDEEDNKNLLMLKERLTSGSDHGTSSAQVHDDTDDEEPQTLEMVTMKAVRNSISTQVNRPTDGEIALRKRVKVMGMRLKRREEKIYYLKTVLNMIKKNFKGTDMDYKLACELENISNMKNFKRNVENKQPTKTESPVDDCAIDDEGLSGDENGTFCEVALSPNLKTQNGVKW